MKRKTLILALVAAGIAGAGGYGLYGIGVNQGMKASAPAAGGAQAAAGNEGAGNVDPATGKKVLYWHDPMVPGQRFEYLPHDAGFHPTTKAPEAGRTGRKPVGKIGPACTGTKYP